MRWPTIERYREWPGGEISRREEKEAVAARVADELRDGQVVGAGSGSTAFLALTAIARRVERDGLRVTAVPTSHEVALACSALGIPTTNLAEARPDWGFDGADEVHEHDGVVRLIKGRGGALFREKLVMASQARTLVLADRSKLVDRLGSLFPIPVETHPEALHLVEQALGTLGASAVALRMAASKDGPVLTEGGHLILDARFPEVPDRLERDLKAIPGVIESGLFVGFAVEIVTPDRL